MEFVESAAADMAASRHSEGTLYGLGFRGLGFRLQGFPTCFTVPPQEFYEDMVSQLGFCRTYILGVGVINESIPLSSLCKHTVQYAPKALL